MMAFRIVVANLLLYFYASFSPFHILSGFSLSELGTLKQLLPWRVFLLAF